VRIAQVCPRYYPNIGGVETHVQEISERLVKRGFYIEVVCTDPSGKLPKHEMINGVIITRFKSFAPGDAYYFAPQIYFYLNRANFDLIHAHNYHTISPLFAALSKKDRKFIFTPHTFGFSKLFPRNIFHKIYKPFGTFIFNSADNVVSISKVEEEWLKKTFRIPDNKLNYIPLPIDIGEAKVEKRSKDDVKIVFVGRLSREKNIDVLISAFKLVKQSHPECKLYIVGDGPLRGYLEGLSAHINNIYFLGRLDHNNAMKFLDDTDIFVLPSQFEVSPISVLEAMAKSIPVIATPVGELPHVLEDGKTCLFTKINDVNDLAMRILVLVEDKFFAKRIAESGRDFVKEKHDINKIIDSYVKLYTQ
jgi:glycosyltransferase involved in cell wall biosynthesis